MNLSRDDIRFSVHRVFELIEEITISILILVQSYIVDDPNGRTGSNSAWVIDMSCECCVLSGRVLCDELVTRPEESY